MVEAFCCSCDVVNGGVGGRLFGFSSISTRS